MSCLTKNELKAKLSLLVSLANITESLGTDIELLLTQDNLDLESPVEELIHEIKTHKTKNVEAIMQALENWGAFDEFEDGVPVPTPYTELDFSGALEIGVQYPDGEKLAAHLSPSDCESTYQTGLAYYTEEGTNLDLAFAEIKRGTLAKTEGLSPNNKDIDMYVYGDVFNEDFTSCIRLSHNDILKALEEEEEDDIFESETPHVIK